MYVQVQPTTKVSLHKRSRSISHVAGKNWSWFIKTKFNKKAKSKVLFQPSYSLFSFAISANIDSYCDS